MAVGARLLVASMFTCVMLGVIALVLRAVVVSPTSRVPPELVARGPELFAPADATTESMATRLRECTEDTARAWAEDDSLSPESIDRCSVFASELMQVVASQDGLMSGETLVALVRYVRALKQVAPNAPRYRRERVEILLAVACSHGVSAANRATFEISQEVRALSVSRDNVETLSTCLDEALVRTEVAITHILAQRVVGRRGYDFVHVRIGVKRYVTWLRRHARDQSTFRPTIVPQGIPRLLTSYERIRAISSEARGERMIEGYLGDYDFRGATANIDRITSSIDADFAMPKDRP